MDLELTGLSGLAAGEEPLRAGYCRTWEGLGGFGTQCQCHGDGRGALSRWLGGRDDRRADHAGGVPVESRSPSYKGHRYPAEVISHCVWLYFRFPLSFSELVPS